MTIKFNRKSQMEIDFRPSQPEPRRYERWLNFYENNFSTSHATEETADSAAALINHEYNGHYGPRIGGKAVKVEVVF